MIHQPRAGERLDFQSTVCGFKKKVGKNGDVVEIKRCGKNSATLRQIAREIFLMRSLVGQRDFAPSGNHQTCLLTSSTGLAAFVTAPEGMKKNELSITTPGNKRLKMIATPPANTRSR